MKCVVCVFLLLVNNLISQNAIAFLEATTREDVPLVNNYEGFLKVPIKVVNGMILVKAEMNGQRGFFILDTGAPMMVVNGQNEGNNPVAASSYSKSFEINSTFIENFKWADIEAKNIEALVVNLEHLERATSHQILGMIGYNALIDREIMVDYSRGEVIVYPARKNPIHRMAVPQASLPFVLQGHLPVVQIQIAGIDLVFGLDTGAGINLIDKKYLDQLPKGSYSNLHQEEIQGLDQTVNQATTVDINQTHIEGLAFGQMPYLFTDLSHLKERSDIQIDGLLGYEFFNHFRFSINYQKQKIYIWEFIQL